MRLTNQMLETFVNGQMLVFNLQEGYMYRGEVKEITFSNEDWELNVEFSWLAIGAGMPENPTRWVNVPEPRLKLCLPNYIIRTFGPGAKGGDRVQFGSMISGDQITMFPPDGERLSPSQVEGLELIVL